MYRVAYVIGELGKGGAEYQLYELVRGLDRSRYEATVFCLSTGGYWAGPLRDLGVPVVELPNRRSLDPGRLSGVRRALAAVRPHVLHTVLWSGNAYGRLAAIGLRIPVVIAAERNVVRRPRWQRAIERGLDMVTTRYLVNTAAIVEELVHQGRLPREKMTVIHNGIDLSRVPPFAIDRAEARRRLGFDPTRRLVAQVGRLEPQKDLPSFLAAAARLAPRHPGVDFLVVGEGRLAEELRHLADGLGLGARVRFTGVRHDVPALLGAVDVLALTSRHEGLPNVVIEAMATGAVPVATDVGGVRELVDDGRTGVVVEAGNVDEIVAAIDGVLADAHRADAMRRDGRRRVEEQFSVEAMVCNTERVYGTELAGRAVAGSP